MMKKISMAMAIGLLMSGMAVSCQAAAGPLEAGALQVIGTQLSDSSGNPIQLKGLSTHGLAWFPQYINEEAFREFHDDWNANVIRLAMYTAESGGYCTDGDKENLKQLIRNGVQYATEQDMYVIVDWHILADQNPLQNMEDAKTFFTEMTAEFGDTENILYEICNEPNGNTAWSDIKAYAEEIIPIIRANDPDAIIIVGTPNWSQYVDQAAADPIKGYENVMYTLHYYAATHKDDLRQKMKEAVNAGLPVFVSEYGICDASGNGSIDKEQANLWVQTMDELGISYVGWNISNKNETSAIFRPECTKVSGFTKEDLSESGTWLYEMLNAGNGVDESVSEKTDTNETGLEEAAQNIQEMQEDSSTEAAEITSDEFQIQATVKNSWEAEGKKFYQYDLSLKNTSGTDVSDWNVKITFSEEIVLSDGWNGNYSVDGTTMYIANKEYNGAVQAGGQVTDIGFIVSAGSELSLVQ